MVVVFLLRCHFLCHNGRVVLLLDSLGLGRETSNIQGQYGLGRIRLARARDGAVYFFHRGQCPCTPGVEDAVYHCLPNSWCPYSGCLHVCGGLGCRKSFDARGFALGQVHETTYSRSPLHVWLSWDLSSLCLPIVSVIPSSKYPMSDY